MDKLFRAKNFKALLPYFLLALAIIVAHRIIGEFEFFVNAVGRALGVIAPFFYGFLLAYIINMPSSSIQCLLAKTKIKFIVKRQRGLSILIVFIMLALLVALIINLVVPAIANSIAFFIANIPAYWESAFRLIDYFNSREFFGWYISTERIFDMIREFFSEFSIENLSRPINAIMGAGATMFSGFITFIASIYILIEKDKFKAFIRRVLKLLTSHEICGVVLDHFARLNKNFRQYIRTQTIDGIILGTLATILLLILGSPYALVLGIMLGIVNYIPYFGSIFGSLAAIVVVAFTQGITMGLISAASLLTIQQIDANVIQPKLMSGSFALSPLLVIISITIGGAIAGIFGMIVAIPIIAVLKDILDNVIAHYERKKLEKPDAGSGG
ncbi:MAG: AI-2E family transporter [Treponema sp.]|nr:AI-2E family transporter [Treponema sp.]